jgi:hypothetical protein
MTGSVHAAILRDAAKWPLLRITVVGVAKMFTMCRFDRLET